MKILNGNLTKCGDCNCVMEYDESDVIPAVECPKCKRLVKVAYMPQVSFKPFSKLSWGEIHDIILEHGEKAFEVGATKKITLKNGEKYTVQITNRADGILLSFKDLYGNDDNGGRPINEDNYERNYEDSDLRRWLNEEFIKLLPDDLARCIVPTEIASNGKILTDKVFIPSEMEVFGKQEYGNCKEGEQFELYADWHNRISGYADGQYSRWYWLRTKASASSSYFCGCNFYGGAGYNNAGFSLGVRPHFLIK